MGLNSRLASHKEEEDGGMSSAGPHLGLSERRGEVRLVGQLVEVQRDCVLTQRPCSTIPEIVSVTLLFFFITLEPRIG